MSKVSAKLSVIKDCLDEYNCIPIKYITKDQLRKNIVSCMTPIIVDGKYDPYVKIFDINTDCFYQIADKNDPYGTECIMTMIRQKIDIPDDTEAIFYSVFCLLHEAGHYFDYMTDPNYYNANYIDEEYCENTPESAKAYRNRPLEKKADKYALEHISTTIIRLNERLFHGYLLNNS